MHSEQCFFFRRDFCAIATTFQLRLKWFLSQQSLAMHKVAHYIEHQIITGSTDTLKCIMPKGTRAADKCKLAQSLLGSVDGNPIWNFLNFSQSWESLIHTIYWFNRIHNEFAVFWQKIFWHPKNVISWLLKINTEWNILLPRRSLAFSYHFCFSKENTQVKLREIIALDLWKWLLANEH